MTTKIILAILLLLPFFRLSAQDVASYDTEYSHPAFESVSFSSDQGTIIITCTDLEKLTHFEIEGENVHYTFEWDNKNPSAHFPMKLGIKPGKFTIKYTKAGKKSNPIELKLEAHDQLKLAL